MHFFIIILRVFFVVNILGPEGRGGRNIQILEYLIFDCEL